MCVQKTAQRRRRQLARRRPNKGNKKGPALLTAVGKAKAKK